MKIVRIGLISALAMTACADDAEFQKVQEIAVATLDQLQQQSFDEKREFCGYVIEFEGVLQATKPNVGDEGSCEIDDPDEAAIILASFHTHGQHNPEYWSEAPSPDDIEADFEEDTYGFVSTPGGRVWLVDPFQEEIFQICGEACVKQDPNYDAADYPAIPKRGTVEEMNALTDS